MPIAPRGASAEQQQQLDTGAAPLAVVVNIDDRRRRCSSFSCPDPTAPSGTATDSFVRTSDRAAAGASAISSSCFKMRGILERRQRQRERKGKRQRRRRRRLLIDSDFVKPAPRARAGEALDARRGGPGRGRIRRLQGGVQRVSLGSLMLSGDRERVGEHWLGRASSAFSFSSTSVKQKKKTQNSIGTAAPSSTSPSGSPTAPRAGTAGTSSGCSARGSSGRWGRRCCSSSSLPSSPVRFCVFFFAFFFLSFFLSFFTSPNSLVSPSLSAT